MTYKELQRLRDQIDESIEVEELKVLLIAKDELIGSDYDKVLHTEEIAAKAEMPLETVLKYMGATSCGELMFTPKGFEILMRLGMMEMNEAQDDS